MKNPAKTFDLKTDASMRDYQVYIHKLESQHGWLDVDLVHNCFLMGEEVGELFKSIRKYNRYFEPGKDESPAAAVTHAEDVSILAKDDAALKQDVAEEIVDVFNYLLAIANRLEIDVEDAFRKKNKKNQSRSWES